MLDWLVPQMMSRIVTVCDTVYHGVTQCPQIHPRFNIRPNRYTTGDQGCYCLEFSYIYKHLIINKKALCLIAEGCTPGVYIIN